MGSDVENHRERYEAVVEALHAVAIEVQTKTGAPPCDMDIMTEAGEVDVRWRKQRPDRRPMDIFEVLRILQERWKCLDTAWAKTGLSGLETKRHEAWQCHQAITQHFGMADWNPRPTQRPQTDHVLPSPCDLHGYEHLDCSLCTEAAKDIP